MVNPHQLTLAREEGETASRMALKGYEVAADVARHAAHLAFLGCDYLGEGEFRSPCVVRQAPSVHRPGTGGKF